MQERTARELLLFARRLLKDSIAPRSERNGVDAVGNSSLRPSNATTAATRGDFGLANWRKFLGLARCLPISVSPVDDIAAVDTLLGSSAMSKHRAFAFSSGERIKAGKRVPEEAIRLRAYQKWESAGMPSGDGVGFWLEAEREFVRMPRFTSFDAGIVTGLLTVGIYMAVASQHWLAAAFLLLGALWMLWIPFRLYRMARAARPGQHGP